MTLRVFLLIILCWFGISRQLRAQVSTLNADSVYAFINGQFGFLSQPPDSIPPYLQLEVLQNILKGGDYPNTIFGDRLSEMNTQMLDTLLSAEEFRHMKNLAQSQSLMVWEEDSLHIAGLELIGKRKLISLLHQKKRRISLALSPPYFSTDYQFALQMIERRSASEGWDALLFWQRQAQGWKVIDAKMWLWHPVVIDKK